MRLRAACSAVVLVCVLTGASASARIVTWSPGAWSWFGDPRAVQVDGQHQETFVGWIDWAGRVTIGAYDPRFGVLRTHVLGVLYPDDQSAPPILVVAAKTE